MQPEASDLKTDGGRVPADHADFRRRTDEHPRPRPGTDAFRDLLSQVRQLKAYGSYFLSAKIDGIKTSIRKAALLGVLGVLGAIFGTALLATAAVILLIGLSGAFAALYGGPEYLWLGHLTVAVLVMLVVGIGAWLFVRGALKSSLRSTRHKYEQHKHEQRVQFGHDVKDCANAARAADAPGAVQ